MIPGPHVFVDVDTQRDFLQPGGPVFVTGSEAILPNLARLTGYARSRAIPIIATACAHAPDDPEFATFPPHCLRGTPGQSRIEETRWDDTHFVAPGSASVPETVVPHLTIEKAFYDVFSTPEAEIVFERYAEGDPTFVVYGVATDYCVACVAEGLAARGMKVAIVVDAIRAVDHRGEAEVLTRFAGLGINLTLTEVICGHRA